MKSYTNGENLLKRWLKKKVNVSMAVVVGFLISGGVVFGGEYTTPIKIIDGEEAKTETISKDINITGILGEKGITGIEIKSSSITNKNDVHKLDASKSNKIIIAAHSSDKDTNGITIYSGGGEVILGNESSESVEIDVTATGYATGIFIVKTNNDNVTGNKDIENIAKGGKVEINGNSLIINAGSTSNYAVGIWTQTNTAYSPEEFESMKLKLERSSVIINSKDTKILIDSESREDGIGIIAYSNSYVEVNGDLEIRHADEKEEILVLSTRGHSIVKINEKENSTVKLKGDIEFNYSGSTSRTTVDSDILVNLSNENSCFEGRIIVSNDNDGTIFPVEKSIVNGMKLGLSNGGKWKNTGDSIVNILTLQGGIVENNDKIRVQNNKNGIQMNGASGVYNSILKGNGEFAGVKVEAVKNETNDYEIKETLQGNTLTISNKGNILELGEDSLITGNVLVNSGAEVTNNGTFKVEKGTVTNEGTINLASGTTITLGENGKLENKKSGIINVSSNATAITNGKAENRGVINLADTKNENSLSKLLSGGELKNVGTISLQDRTGKMSSDEWEELSNKLATTGDFKNIGMIADSQGNSIISGGTSINGDTTVGDIVEGAGKDEGIKIDGEKVTISGSKTDTTPDKLEDITVNVEGNLILAGKDSQNIETGVVMGNITMNVANNKNVTVTGTENKLSGTINLNGNSTLKVDSNANVTVSGTVSQGAGETNQKAEIKNEGELNLVDADIKVAINSSDTINNTTTVNSAGETNLKDIKASILNIQSNEDTKNKKNITTISGDIAIKNIVVGTANSPTTFDLATRKDEIVTDILRLTADSNFTEDGAIKIEKNGQVHLGIEKDGNNAFAKTDKEITVTGGGADNTTDLILETAKLSGDKVTVSLGKNVEFTNVTGATDSKIYILELENNTLAGKNITVDLKYNDKLYGDNHQLNKINNAAAVVSYAFSVDDENKRAVQLDKIYSENIYSETVRASYNSLKLTEEALLTLNHDTKAGELKADGKMLYSKEKYSKGGLVSSYDIETETTGLLASIEYGVSDTTTAGFAFAGLKQDVDAESGKADGDIFYLGVYSTKVTGNYDFTAGLGYQYGKYDADNNIGIINTSDKYESNALRGYVQGRYTIELGDKLVLQPKVKLGYTHIEQKDTRDLYFGVSDAEINLFDGEIGAELNKTISAEKKKINLVVGASYIRTVGDTDKKFNGNFYGVDETRSIDVLGAEITEHRGKLNVGAEVSYENGFFYNGGVTYEFGNDDTEAYSIKLGAGYRF